MKSIFKRLSGVFYFFFSFFGHGNSMAIILWATDQQHPYAHVSISPAITPSNRGLISLPLLDSLDTLGWLDRQAMVIFVTVIWTLHHSRNPPWHKIYIFKT